MTYQFVEENKDGGLFYRLHEGKENRFRVFGRWLLQDYSNLKLLPLSSELPERFIIGEEHPAKLHFIIDQENKITISEGNQNFNMEKIERDIKEEFDSPAKKEMNN